MTLAAGTAQAADIESGKLVAERWCISCHSPGTLGGAGIALPFTQLLQSRSPEAIAAYWQKPHGSMRQIELKPQQFEDLTAYIRSLKQDR